MPFNKKAIIDSIVYELKKEFAVLVKSAMEAKDAATNEESKAENKYDTRGLEASYLAGAQASRAQQVRRAMVDFEKIEIKEYSSTDEIGSTALIRVSIDDEDEKWFFLLPQKGGMNIQVEKDTVTTLSMDSPLGDMLIGKKVGDDFELEIAKVNREYVIEEVY